ncbi:hypothetical protein [Nocardia carnea]|uniref:hypothetical protein n=1 Tax=Nocardia carnea TaxID=37328 RepID=UPI002453EF3A|nr:hypothetical protein [Nocardia carnea]
MRKGREMSGADYLNSEEYTHNQAIFDQLNAEKRNLRAARDADPNRGTIDDIDPETLRRLRARANDMVTPETEGWHQDADHWYNGAGEVVYTRGADGWYDTSGIRVYDLVYNRITQ